jgi:AbrB family looped-hinge helix DNA binding protein
MEFRHRGHGRHGGSAEQPGQYFGTTTIGERGQIVIPKAARELFGLAPGDKLLVLGSKERGGLALVKADLMERFAAMFLGGSLPPDETDQGPEGEETPS